MLGFAPLSTLPLSGNPAGTYTPIDTTIAASVAVVAAGGAAHGVSASGLASVAITAALGMDFTAPGSDATIAASVAVVAAGDAAHGVSASGAASVGVGASLEAAHGVSASISASASVVSAASAAHGVSSEAVAAVTLAAHIEAVAERYELIGEVRLAGILVNRRVRVYRRDTGALVGEADTVGGHFRVHAGFSAEAEFTVLPIDLAADATDWAPPAANRVIPVLAMDA